MGPIIDGALSDCYGSCSHLSVVCVCFFLSARVSPKDRMAPAPHWLRIPSVAARDWPTQEGGTSKAHAARRCEWIAIAEASTELRDCTVKISV